MSQLPAEVREWTLDRAATVPFDRLKAAAAHLSETYRSHKPTAATALTPAERTAAYLAVRFPATYAAARAVFRECTARLPEVTSLLDLGAGCGAATLAARETLPELEQCTLIEADRALASAGREVLPSGQWQVAGLEEVELPEADLVVASYALNELTDDAREAVLSKAWAAARVALVVIEPGSKAGFAIIRQIRDRFAEHVAAPCPNALPCPMPADDWCHFAARVERTALHRQLKDGGLSYEDEKFSYIALSKRPCTPAPARIVGRPAHSPGLIRLTLCEGGRIEHRNVTKRHKEDFRKARKSEWGDAWTAAEQS